VPEFSEQLKNSGERQISIQHKLNNLSSIETTAVIAMILAIARKLRTMSEFVEL